MDSNNPALKTTFGAGGQIVRILLEGFMSTDYVEVFPGMHLNLVIGPNGTGKSTLLSAVLLGLGGKISSLNKTNNLKSFIKAGRNKSSIEIELYNPKGANHVIRREIVDTGSSEYSINGNLAKKNQVDEIRNHYNIQLDNLCCFLSQDKVQDFSKLTPEQLLENTEMTIGKGELLDEHNDLKQLRNELLKHQSSIAKTEENISKETGLNDRLKGQVQAIKEKLALGDKVTVLNQKKHWLLYNEALKDLKEIEQDLKAAEIVAENHNEKLKIERNKLLAIEENSRTQKNSCEVAKREEAGKKLVMEDRLGRFQQQVEQFNALDAKHEFRIREENDKKGIMNQYQSNIDKLTNELAALTLTNGKPFDDLSVSNLKRKEDYIINEKQKLEDEARNLKHELIGVNRKMTALKGVRDRRLKQLERSNPDLYKAIHWLDSNRHLFKNKIFNPLILELDVTDASMVSHVEAVIPASDLMAFCVTQNSDLNELIKKLRMEQGLKINVVSAEDALRNNIAPAEPIEKLRMLGFQKYLIDCITGPPEIMKYLCQNFNIHKIPVGTDQVNSNISKVPPNFKRFFSNDQEFTVKISQYQNRAKSTTVKKLQPPRAFKEQFDRQEIARLEVSEENLKRKIADLQSQIDQLDTNYSEIQEKLSDFRKQKRELAGEAERRLHLQVRLERAQEELARCRASLKDPKLLGQELVKERQALKAKLNRLMDDLHKAQEAYDAANFKRLQTALLYKSCTIGQDAIKEAEQQTKSALNKAEETVTLIESKRQRADRTRKHARSIAKELTDGITPEQPAFKNFKKEFEKLPDTIEAIEHEMGSVKARADFLDGGSVEVLTQYNKREREIATLKSELEVLRVEEVSQTAALDQKRQAWLDPVKLLIERLNITFSQNFEIMGCAGEVSLSVPEDQYEFDLYGVSIRVKYRAEMPLQELTRHYQSGGERTVATAVYGLSLQYHSNVPFRFVDEINQGMDAQYEGYICKMLSYATSQTDSPQYFYLTPKIMQNFHCPETMAVLCVFNGTGALTSNEWDISKFICQAKENSDDDMEQ